MRMTRSILIIGASFAVAASVIHITSRRCTLDVVLLFAIGAFISLCSDPYLIDDIKNLFKWRKKGEKQIKLTQEELKILDDKLKKVNLHQKEMVHLSCKLKKALYGKEKIDIEKIVSLIAIILIFLMITVLFFKITRGI